MVLISRAWTKRIGGACKSAAVLEVTCAVLALSFVAAGIKLPKNSRRHRMPQFDYSIHDYEEARPPPPRY